VSVGAFSAIGFMAILILSAETVSVDLASLHILSRSFLKS